MNTQLLFQIQDDYNDQYDTDNVHKSDRSAIFSDFRFLKHRKYKNDYLIIINQNAIFEFRTSMTLDDVESLFNQLRKSNNIDFDKIDWRNNGESPLYHATDSENTKSILQKGLEATTGTGLSNRGEYGIFTTTNSDEVLGVYGDSIISIDIEKLLSDFPDIHLYREPDIRKSEMINWIFSVIDRDQEIQVDIDNSVSPNSWIIQTDIIPPQYLHIIN